MMAKSCPRIDLLPDEVWAKVSSSCEITSSEHVIEGLLRNALDADASSIAIEVEFSKGYISICDNGSGIKQVEFSEQGQLARLHCSSKLNCSDSMYGRYGRFLSNLSHLSLLSIASEHQSEEFANRLILHRGNAVCRQLRLDREDVGIMRKGTTITVHNLFGDVPVRFKHLSQLYSSSTETERTFNRVKEMLVGYLLAQSRPVEVRFSTRCERLHSLHCRTPLLSKGNFSLESTLTTLSQAKLVMSLDATNWRSASVRTSHFCIRAVISLEPCPNKSTQFISVGNLPIRRGQRGDCLFDAIDRLYEDSSFGSLDLDLVAPHGATRGPKPEDSTGQTIKLQRAVDRWPMFHIHIEPRTQELSHQFGLGHSLADMIPVIEHVTKAVESLVSNFLTAYGYSAGPGCNASRMVQGRRKHEDGSCHPLVEESTTKLSKLATEARYLNHWRRVKSARPPPDDFRFGLGLRKSDDLSSLSTQTPEGHLLFGTLHIEEPDPEEAVGDTQIDSNDDDHDESVFGLPWVNSRYGQVIYLHPRTGGVLPLANLDLVRPDGTRGCSTRMQSQWPRLCKGNDGQSPWAKPMLNLQQYLQTSSHHQPETPIPGIMSGLAPGFSVKRHLAGGQDDTVRDSQVITKGSLQNATIIQQVDRKFILAILAVQDKGDPYLAERTSRRLLVLVDQHAADERVKFEKLCDDFCKRTSMSLTKPLVFEVDETEARVLGEHRQYFWEWCVSYRIVENTKAEQSSKCSRSPKTWAVEVTALPALIIERCRADPKLLADIMRGEIWLGRTRRRTPLPHPPQSDAPSWWSDIADCPKGIIEMLKSRSCRTAVMFNDHLDTRQCQKLVQRLSQCTFPFQCAHGRPTLTVLADIGGGDYCGPGMGADVDPSAVALGFGDAWRGWAK
ncbi:uncharacterized protein PV07_06397 [Cladophialophora immunda]|uniref:MutL C-terminal dimerisation domain-containing protein n=1 Tax=Cladophialophora immunda TaxID=569365 RepID=A0A0D2D4R9_9EURO|nr:uncharacterized protein PV07_06397 [Cladophialophora immunda]KIW30674.1 hypothetical protein PV07_06397 [Cladophialophora immunda]